MFSDIDPMMATFAVVALAVVCSIVGVARRSRSEPVTDRSVLPAGADAALWSVTEVLPDPRNHLAIKDPTSELRLTARERAEAAVATPPVRPAEAARTAQSIAARRAALAKRVEPEDDPLVTELEEPADARHLTLLAPEQPTPVAAAPTPDLRWGETSVRAS